MQEEDSDSVLQSLLKRRGFVLPAFESYGGVSGFIDYGPNGASVRRRFLDAWRNHWLARGDIVEVHCPTVTPKEVLEASGHVGGFSDSLSECRACGSAHRTDHLLEDALGEVEGWPHADLDAALAEHKVKCPECKSLSWSPTRSMNLMFATNVGPGTRARSAFLRPETAQGMFTMFPTIHRHFRQKLPFGALQIGHGYRNEISPRQGMIRLREFSMAELEYFFDPEDPPSVDLECFSHQHHMISQSGKVELTLAAAHAQGIMPQPLIAMMLGSTLEFLESVGIDLGRTRLRQHRSDEMAHYASDCWDIEIQGPYGWVECVGVAHRGCHDLKQHETASPTGQFRAWRAFDQPRRVHRHVVKGEGAVLGPRFKHQSGEIISALLALENIPESWPFTIELSDGSMVEIDETMASVVEVDEEIHGTWYLPHVVEPAFGVDRILYHIFEHSLSIEEKEGESYLRLNLSAMISPYDVAVLPLMDKDGLNELAIGITQTLRGHGMVVEHDVSGSIGRRYARCDEIGVPWVLTVDHDSLKNGDVTVRRRSDGHQIRIPISDLTEVDPNKLELNFPPQS